MVRVVSRESVVYGVAVCEGECFVSRESGCAWEALYVDVVVVRGRAMVVVPVYTCSIVGGGLSCSERC